MQQKFTHLHVHTEYSLLDGLARMKDLFGAAAAHGQSALAVTDHGAPGGLWKAKKYAAEAGVKLIPGAELYLAIDKDGSFGDRHAHTYQVVKGDLADDSDESDGEGAGEKRKNYYHLTLLATNRRGWENLLRITNAAERSKWSKYPMADLRLIAENTEGLVALTGCLGGPVLGPVAGGNIELAESNLTALVGALGKDNVYLEVMEHGIGAETAALPKMWELSQSYGLPLVATNDSHFTHDCDAHAHDAWLALRTLSGKTTETNTRPIDDPKRYRFTGHGYHVRSTEEMYGLFAPERPEEHGWPLTSRQVSTLAEALDSPILRHMLAPGVVTDELVAAAQAWMLAPSGDIDDDTREFVLRVVREATYLKQLGRPSQTPSHPRNWWAQACANTQLIADRTDDNVMPDGNALLPVYPTPEGFDSNERFLAGLISAGIDGRFPGKRPQEVSERLNTEWKTISDMGFVDYFLIVWDVVDWARSDRCIHRAPGKECTHDDCSGTKKPILVGPGRGSGAGSLVAWSLGITGLDPLRHDLLFERFIEYGRSDWPDFDIDFERLRREDILDYLTLRWGEGHVALIGSYGVAKSRRSVKDAGRLLGHASTAAKLTKVIPVVEGNPLGFDALLDPDNAQTAEFRRVLAMEGDAGREVLDLARSFDATTNGASIHACGVIVSDRYLPDLIPLRVKTTELEDGTIRERLVTHWDSKDCESFGLLKLDILALRTLDIMHTAFDYIAETTGEHLTMETIPHPSVTDDPRVDKAWALLRAGRTAGIFQAEGAAMTQLIQDVQPENEEHLSAIYALFRPGPISAGMPEHYGLRKNGKETVNYDLYTADTAEQEWIATRLGKSYGILAYQEQMMLLGTTIAGFDAGQRSGLRRAIGKKDKVKMAAMKEDFFDGATREFRDEQGTVISPVFKVDTAARLWAMFEGAASYAFNASHSMAYAYLGYYTAFLKANWPGAFGAAILANTTESDRRVEALLALPAEGIRVLAPDVNLSGVQSRPEGDDQVRIGLGEITEMKSSASAIVRTREESGIYRDIGDLGFRVRLTEGVGKTLPSNQILSLVESGALDSFGTRFGQAMVSRIADHVLPAPVPTMEWGIIERSARQRQRLGVSLGEHPLVVFRDQVAAWRKPIQTSYGTFEEAGIPIGRIPEEAGAVVTVIGLLAQFSEGSYKGGRKAAIVLEGSNSRIDCIMWDKELSEQRVIGIPSIGWPVAVTGKVTVREFEKEDEEGNVTLTKIRQLTVNRIDVVNIDDPLQGSLPAAAAVPDFVSSPEPEAPASATTSAEPVDVIEDAPEEVAESEAVAAATTSASGVPVFELTKRVVRTELSLMSKLPPALRSGVLEPEFSARRRRFTVRGGGGDVLCEVVLV